MSGVFGGGAGCLIKDDPGVQADNGGEFSKLKESVKAERAGKALEDFLCAAARTETQVEENRGDGFGVAKTAATHHSFQLADGKRFGLDLLVRVGAGDSRRQTLRGVDHQALVDKAGSGEEGKQLRKPPSGISGLFGQFAARSGERFFSRLDAAGDKLPKILPYGVTILMHQESPPIRENGNYHHRAIVNHKF